jgi:hypothetical protein
VTQPVILEDLHGHRRRVTARRTAREKVTQRPYPPVATGGDGDRRGGGSAVVPMSAFPGPIDGVFDVRSATDLYEVRMAASYLRRCMTGLATFSMFARRLPRRRTRQRR